jgi:hypothetical protein
MTHAPAVAALDTPHVRWGENGFTVTGGQIRDFAPWERDAAEMLLISLADGTLPMYLREEFDRRERLGQVGGYALAAAERDAPGAVRRVTVEPISSPVGSAPMSATGPTGSNFAAVTS